METFQRHQGISSSTSGPPDRFFERLAGVTEPEDKRKAIGELFIRVFEGTPAAAWRTHGSWSGDPVPRRDRVGHRARRDHQEPPQRRRPATGTWTSTWSNRCGCCSRTRCAVATSSACRRDRVASAVPRSGSGGAHHRRGDPRDGGAVAEEADAIVRESCASPGWNARSGRRSRCCPTSAPLRDGRRAHLFHPVIIRAVTSEDAMTRTGPASYDVLSRWRAGSSTRCRA